MGGILSISSASTENGLMSGPGVILFEAVEIDLDIRCVPVSTVGGI